jgi:hypothetical protein|tara:strand:- start:901 stop:1263 length:363 start_codon:yes stop_codon:yes gene_type:complete
MAHYAKVKDGKVLQVVVAEQDVLSHLGAGYGESWIQTSYNTRGGKHYGPDGKEDEGTPLRANYAGVGFTYDINHDVFYEPQPYASWILNSTTYLWEAPVAYPSDDKYYIWNEDSKNWVEP